MHNRLVQNPLDPNLLQASIQGPFSFTHILSVAFYASFCFPVPKLMSCVLDFCYCSTLFLIPHSVPVIFCYITNHYKTSWLKTTMWAVLGGNSWSLFPAVSAVVAWPGLEDPLPPQGWQVGSGCWFLSIWTSPQCGFASSHMPVGFQEWTSQERRSGNCQFLKPWVQKLAQCHFHHSLLVKYHRDQWKECQRI